MSTKGTYIEALIAAGRMKKTWIKIQRWYEQAKGHPKTPTIEGMDHTSNLREGTIPAELPRGRGDTNTSATGEDLRQNPGRGGYCSGSMGTTHGAGGGSIRYEYRIYKGLEKGGEKEKGPRTKPLVQPGECEKDGILIGEHPDDTEMDKNDDNS